jgi:hypothetical protein
MQMISSEAKVFAPAPAGCGVPDAAILADNVEQQIIDFLSGRTHGETLLHALHDHVLDEPIPERMLALLRQDCAAACKPD